MGEGRSSHASTVISKLKPLHPKETPSSEIRPHADGFNHTRICAGMGRRSSTRRKAETEEHQKRLESAQTGPWQTASEGLDNPFTEESEDGATLVHSRRNAQDH